VLVLDLLGFCAEKRADLQGQALISEVCLSARQLIVLVLELVLALGAVTSLCSDTDSPKAK